MSETKRLIRREIRARKELIVGTVLTRRVIRAFSPSATAPVWVVDVDIGGNNVLQNVPIKSGGDGSRFYADQGQTVLLRRNALGRWQVIGPGETKIGQLTVETFDPNTAVSGGTAAQGFTVVTEPLHYLKGPQAMKGGDVVTFAAAGGTITRADGGPGVGSFIDDGFVAPATVRVVGSVLNDGTYSLSSVAATVLTFTAPGFTDEGPIQGVGIGVALTALWGDGVTPLKTVRIFDADGNIVPPSV